MSLQLSLHVIFVIVDHSLVGNRNEDLLAVGVGQVVHSVKDMVVEAQSPLEL